MRKRTQIQLLQLIRGGAASKTRLELFHFFPGVTKSHVENKKDLFTLHDPPLTSEPFEFITNKQLWKDGGKTWLNFSSAQLFSNGRSPTAAHSGFKS